MSARAFLPAALALTLSAAAAAGGCGSNPASTTTGGPGTSASSSSGGPPDAHVWTDCQASDQAWVRRAILGLDGRRSWGQAEVNAYEDAVKALRKAEGAAPPVAGADLDAARRLVAQQLMTEDAFRERWTDFLLDALHVNRIELKSQQDCYGPPSPSAADDGSLAAFVRDSDPGASQPPLADFTMGQLLSSALQLDDLSVVYRGNLFAMMHLPIDGANVDFVAMERIRRQDFGSVFSSAYIHRDLVCLSCHNSEFSVTFNQDPALNRDWSIPGLFERSLYGSSDGKHPAAEAATKGPDDLRAVSMLRFADVVDDNASKPWGWGDACGHFAEPMNDDPLAIDAYFGSVRSTPDAPGKGLRASVWDVERALHRGVDLLAAHGLRRGPNGDLADPDEAFAYLVAANIVEKVWNEVVGHQLTIANYLPRTEVQRDILMGLTEHFVATHFSLKSLLLDIVAHPAFNLKAPDQGCGVAPYEVPNVFDPWTVAEADLGKRGNSPADGVFAVSSRPLVRSLHLAMGWPFVDEYPMDESFEVALGFFIKDGDPGFRGLDFQGRLTWESTYAACVDLSGGTDLIASIVQQAGVTPGATVGAAVLALKDRLLGEPSLAAAEKADLEALVGGSLDATDLTGLDQKLRVVCGVLVSTPQFMLGGIPTVDTRTVPALAPPTTSYAGTCAALAQFVKGSGAPYTMTCAAGTTTATHP